MNDYSQMVSDLAKPGEDIANSLTPNQAHIWHMVTGVAGEYLELIENQTENKGYTNLVEEMGDLYFYLTALKDYFKASFSDAYLIGPPDTTLLRLGVAAGLVLDIAKKWVVYQKALDEKAMVEAIRMTSERYFSVVSVLGLDMDEIIEHSMHKLLKGENARYKTGAYSDEQAQARRDKQ